VLINQILGPDARTTTVELKVNSLQAATGPNLMAEAEIIKLGRTLVIAEAKCYENDVLLVATACGTFYCAAGKWQE
jgi:acyl-coenzyme A thioesterase PaaI-like protein